MITHSNYEVYIIDYFDGKLDKRAEGELLAFLENNPDLKAEFESYATAITTPDLTIVFNKKDALKKGTVTNLNYKTRLVKDLENDLTADQKKERDTFLSDQPELKSERELVSQLKVIPDIHVVYKDKHKLKKGGKIIYLKPALLRAISVAAVILLFLIAYFLIQQQKRVAPMMSEDAGKSINIVNDNKKQQINNDQVIDKKVIVPEKVDNQPINKINKQINKNQEHFASVKNNKKIQSDHEENIGYASNKTTFSLPAENDDGNGSDPTESNSCESYVAPTAYPVAENLSLDHTATENKNNFYKDIFDDTDLKELGYYQENNWKVASPKPVTLITLAANEIKNIAKSADIIVDKKKNAVANTTTYAFTVRNVFSVSHTVVR